MLSEPAGGLCSVQTNTGPPEYRKWRRGHGLQLPLHPQQVVGWLALGFSAATCFLVLVPALTVQLQPALLAVFCVLYLLHVASHVTALLLDPADPALRKLKEKQPVPEFDRTKHAHVIENGRCHLCNIQTSSPRTKHCSVCNKCVGKFDHHCKWLNHCIGGRNYASFLMCVTSAVVTAIAVLLVCLGEIVVYYVNPQWLSQWTEAGGSTASSNDTDSTGSTTTSQSSDAAFLVIVGALGILAAITAGLLLHLCFFHVYISFLGLTTYEYIRAYRPNLMSTAPPPSEMTSQTSTSNQVRHRPSTLHCCDRTSNPSRQNVTFYACAIVEDNKCTPRVARFHENGFACCSTQRRVDENIPEDIRRNDSTPNGRLKSSLTPVDECKCCGVITVSSPETEPTPGKSPSKKQRFQGKWNCCSAVPDSPDDSRYVNDHEHQSECVLSLCKFKSKIKSNSVSSGAAANPTTTTNPNAPAEWYGARRPSRAALRIRLLFRVLSNLRTRRRNQNSAAIPNQYRNNQVVPLSERSVNEQTIISEVHSQVVPLPAAPLASRRRNSNGLSSTELLSSLAASSQPARLNNLPDLTASHNNIRRTHDLVESLNNLPLSTQSAGSIRRYRRRRRHTVLHNRPKSPTLSPIHESGLSNPASPVPCRHSVCSVSTISNNVVDACANNENTQMAVANIDAQNAKNENDLDLWRVRWLQEPDANN